MSSISKKSETEQQRAAPAKRAGAVKAGSETFPGPGKLLVPLDFSEMSFHALEYAGPLALHFKASLCLVHTVETAAFMNDLDNVSLMISEQEIAGKAMAKLRRLARPWQARGLAVECQVAKGRAYQAICEAAEKTGADLIVISTHGYTGFKKALLGSTTERVVQQAPCPVLVLRQSTNPATQPGSAARQTETPS